MCCVLIYNQLYKQANKSIKKCEFYLRQTLFRVTSAWPINWRSCDCLSLRMCAQCTVSYVEDIHSLTSSQRYCMVGRLVSPLAPGRRGTSALGTTTVVAHGNRRSPLLTSILQPIVGSTVTACVRVRPGDGEPGSGSTRMGRGRTGLRGAWIYMAESCSEL